MGYYEDMVLYWAWRGSYDNYREPPTKKRIEYADVVYPNSNHMRIASTVWDDDKATEICRPEIEWHRRNGAVVELPA